MVALAVIVERFDYVTIGSAFGRYGYVKEFRVYDEFSELDWRLFDVFGVFLPTLVPFLIESREVDDLLPQIFVVGMKIGGTALHVPAGFRTAHFLVQIAATIAARYMNWAVQLVAKRLQEQLAEPLDVTIQVGTQVVLVTVQGCRHAALKLHNAEVGRYLVISIHHAMKIKQANVPTISQYS